MRAVMIVSNALWGGAGGGRSSTRNDGREIGRKDEAGRSIL